MNATRRDEFRPFAIDVHPRRDFVRVAPVGEIDLATVGPLRERIGELLSAGFSRLTLDLQGVTFMDSLGLGTLVVGHRICGDMGVRFTVRNPSSFVAHLLTVSGFGERLLES